MASTWAEALLDESVVIRWLLVLSSPAGTVARLSSCDLDIGGTTFRKGLRVDSPPGISVDPYASTATRGSARVTIAPVPDGHADIDGTLRPYDLPEATGVSFVGMTAELSRWAEGTPLSERDVRLSGYVDAASLASSGELGLELVTRLARFDRKLPRYLVDKAYNTDCHEDDAGEGINILFGAFTRVSCPVVDVANKRVAVGEGTVTVSAAYRSDSTASSTATSQATDDRGFSYTRITLSNAPDDDDFTATGSGLLDDGTLTAEESGYFTGTAAALISHPADQLHALARGFAGWSAAQVNAASFVALREETPGWVGAVQALGSQETTFSAICADACRLLRAVVYEDGGRLTARRLDFTRPPVLHLREGSNLREVIGIEWATQQDRPTRLTVRYNYGWRRKKKMMDYKSSAELNELNFAPFAANLAANEAESVELSDIETKHYADDATVTAALASLGELHGVERKGITVRVGREGHGLKIYDVVSVTARTAPAADGLGWSEKLAVVVGIPRSDLDENEVTLLEV